MRKITLTAGRACLVSAYSRGGDEHGIDSAAPPIMAFGSTRAAVWADRSPPIWKRADINWIIKKSIEEAGITIGLSGDIVGPGACQGQIAIASGLGAAGYGTSLIVRNKEWRCLSPIRALDTPSRLGLGGGGGGARYDAG